MTTDFFNSTIISTTKSAETNLTSLILAYVCLFISSLAWGGFYLPVKHVDTGDGIFFNLIMTMGLWSTGPIIHWIRGFPKFYILPAFGGFIWTLGNVNTVIVIKLIGIGLGALFWNLAGTINGWMIPRFGLLGLKKQVPKYITMNYCGVFFTLVSIIIFVFVKTTPQEVINSKSKEEHDAESLNDKQINNDEEFLIKTTSIEKSRLENFLEKFSLKLKRIIGITLAIFAGLMYGFSGIPIIYCQNNYENSSQDFNDYHFSYVSGCFLGAVVIFIIYGFIEKNNPKIFSEAILSAFVVGLLWVVGQISYNFSSNSLTQSVVIPICNCGPSAIAFIIGLIYKEIKGKKNYLILAAGLFFALTGSILCGLSN